jgi:hypothetical protein
MSRFVDLLGEAARMVNSDPVRPGQALMNALFELDRGVYQEVVDNGLDCFYTEGAIPQETILFIAERMD